MSELMEDAEFAEAWLPRSVAALLMECSPPVQAYVVGVLKRFVEQVESKGVTLDPVSLDVVLEAVATTAIASAMMLVGVVDG